MKEELQGKLVEILTSIQTATGQAKDFALTQLPDIAQSYVMYGRASTVVYLLIGIASIAVIPMLIRILIKATEADEPGIGVPSAFGIFFAGVFGIVLILSNLSAAMLVWFAPKVWLLKELAAMVK